MTSVMPVAAKNQAPDVVVRSVPVPCALTAQEEKLWSDTRVALLWHCPAFAHILYSMLDNCGSKHVALFTEDIPIAATDGVNLLLNHKRFFKYNLNERIFICVHEIMHCIWNHCGLMHQFMRRGKVSYPDGTSLPYDQEIMNIATDLVINDCLIESKVGMFNPDWLHDQNVAVAKDSAIDAYRKCYKKYPPGKSKLPGGSFDIHLPPGYSTGKDPTTTTSSRNEVEWTTQVAAALNAARAQGRLPAGLDRLLGEILEPKVDWTDKVHAFFARKVGSGSYDWRIPDRRFMARDIYAPARSGHGAGIIVIAVDTSGSISERELNMFFAEMSGILTDLSPRRLVVMWCDAKVHRCDDIEEASDLEDLRRKKAPGGGGTSFIPVFDEIEEMGLEPDALVYLTDGYGSFPMRPPVYPVLWGDITGKDVVQYPFGEVVYIPRQASEVT